MPFPNQTDQVLLRQVLSLSMLAAKRNIIAADMEPPGNGSRILFCVSGDAIHDGGGASFKLAFTFVLAMLFFSFGGNSLVSILVAHGLNFSQTGSSLF